MAEKKSKIKNRSVAKAMEHRVSQSLVRRAGRRQKSKIANKTSSSGQNSGIKSIPSTKKATPSSKKEPQTMEELLSQTGYTIKGYKRGDEVKGRILTLTPKQMIVDIGGKSYGVVLSREMAAIADLVPKLTIGEEITATVVIPEDEYGQVVLSLRKSSIDKRWQVLKDTQKQDQEIEVTGIETVKGGLLIDYAGVRGFIPASRLDPSFAANPTLLRGRKITAKILELDQSSNRFVVSQRAVTQKELLSSQQAILTQIKEGESLDAVVTGIVPFGAFAQMSLAQDKEAESVVAIEGLIHISEIAWERVENPNDYLKVGQKVKVKVIGKEITSGKLNLSLKQLMPDPWEDLGKKYKPDQTVKGRVARVSHFGVFIQLEPGVEGLIHISKMPVGFAPKVGNTVEAVIESMDLEKRKISLSIVTKEKPIGYR